MHARRADRPHKSTHLGNRRPGIPPQAPTQTEPPEALGRSPQHLRRFRGNARRVSELHPPAPDSRGPPQARPPRRPNGARGAAGCGPSKGRGRAAASPRPRRPRRRPRPAAWRAPRGTGAATSHTRARMHARAHAHTRMCDHAPRLSPALGSVAQGTGDAWASLRSASTAKAATWRSTFAAAHTAADKRTAHALNRAVALNAQHSVQHFTNRSNTTKHNGHDVAQNLIGLGSRGTLRGGLGRMTKGPQPAWPSGRPGLTRSGKMRFRRSNDASDTGFRTIRRKHRWATSAQGPFGLRAILCDPADRPSAAPYPQHSPTLTNAKACPN